MSRLDRFFQRDAVIPSLIILLAGELALFSLFLGISHIEVQDGGHPVFAYHFGHSFGRMRYWLFCALGQGVATALTVVVWGDLQADLTLNHVRIPILIRRVFGTNLAWVCVSGIVYFPLKLVMSVF